MNTRNICMVGGVGWGINLSGNERSLNNSEILFSTNQIGNVFIMEIPRLTRVKEKEYSYAIGF